jgi:hypothetical protein
MSIDSFFSSPPRKSLVKGFLIKSPHNENRYGESNIYTIMNTQRNTHIVLKHTYCSISKSEYYRPLHKPRH